MGLYAAIEGLGSFMSAALVQVTHSLHLGWIRSESHFNEVLNIRHYFSELSHNAPFTQF